MVLGAQFIQTSDYHETRIFKVSKGTGMGTVCSGEISALDGPEASQVHDLVRGAERAAQLNWQSRNQGLREHEDGPVARWTPIATEELIPYDPRAAGAANESAGQGEDEDDPQTGLRRPTAKQVQKQLCVLVGNTKLRRHVA